MARSRPCVQGWCRRLPDPADKQTRRHAADSVRRILENLTERPSERQLTGAAHQSGRWLERGDLTREPWPR